jgi:hypothetical protein
MRATTENAVSTVSGVRDNGSERRKLHRHRPSQSPTMLMMVPWLTPQCVAADIACCSSHELAADGHFALWATACETALWPAGTFARANIATETPQSRAPSTGPAATLRPQTHGVPQ